MDEELTEYHQNQNLEDLERVRAEKYAKRSGFRKKILLKEVKEL